MAALANGPPLLEGTSKLGRTLYVRRAQGRINEAVLGKEKRSIEGRFTNDASRLHRLSPGGVNTSFRSLKEPPGVGPPLMT